LKVLVDALGEDDAKGILSEFLCPLNPDVERFLKDKAIEFSKQGLAQTHLVFASYQQRPVLIGYYALASKYITISAKNLSSNLKRRIARFSTYNSEVKSYCLSAPLIAQLGKNYAHGYDKLITGDELLKLACDKVSAIQMDLGGRFAYLECEDTPKLIEFYTSNGFCEFDRRMLDKDETGLNGAYLVQLLKYIKQN
jgi:hypothetical protein